MKEIRLSTLTKTWLIDIDGTIFKHNSHLGEGDVVVPGFLEFYNRISAEDRIILLTSRLSKYRNQTIASLHQHHIRYNEIIFDLPQGERILINDTKPQGLHTAIAINTARDRFPDIELIIDNTL